jgi:hypothetical protein
LLVCTWCKPVVVIHGQRFQNFVFVCVVAGRRGCFGAELHVWNGKLYVRLAICGSSYGNEHFGDYRNLDEQRQWHNDYFNINIWWDWHFNSAGKQFLHCELHYFTTAHFRRSLDQPLFTIKFYDGAYNHRLHVDHECHLHLIYSGWNNNDRLIKWGLPERICYVHQRREY